MFITPIRLKFSSADSETLTTVRRRSGGRGRDTLPSGPFHLEAAGSASRVERYVQSVLEMAGEGPPGLEHSMVPLRNTGIKLSPGEMHREHRIVYRDAQGHPLAAASIVVFDSIDGRREGQGNFVRVNEIARLQEPLSGSSEHPVNAALRVIRRIARVTRKAHASITTRCENLASILQRRHKINAKLEQ